MPDINLLPPEDRKKEREEQTFVKNLPKKTEVVFTNPPKEPSKPQAMALPRARWWKRLFAPKSPQLPKPLPQPLPPILKPPPVPPLAKVVPPSVPAVPSQATGASIIEGITPQPWWRRLFGTSQRPPRHPQLSSPLAGKQTTVARMLPEAPSLLPSKESPPALPVPSPPQAPREGARFPEAIPQPKASPPASPAKFTERGKPPPKSGIIGGVSLLPEEYQKVDEQAVLNLILTLVAAVVISASIVGLSYLLLDQTLRLTFQHELNNLKVVAREQESAARREEGRRLEALRAQKKIAAVGQLIDRHRYWTRPLALIARLTDHDVVWAGVAMENPTTIALSGNATSLRAVARQLVRFRGNDKVTAVLITGASAGEEATMKTKTPASTTRYPFTFTASLTIDPSVVLITRGQALEENGSSRP